MDSSEIKLDEGVTHVAWNFSCHRFAAASNDGFLRVWDRKDHGTGAFSCTSAWKAHDGPVLKVVWAPPEYGDVVVSSSTSGSVSLWEEVGQSDGGKKWTLLSQLQDAKTSILDLQFANCLSGLKLVMAGADGIVKLYETIDSIKLKQWQLQAEFPNLVDMKEVNAKVVCTSSSISWRPPVDSAQRPVFVLGYTTSFQQFCSAKVWEFAEAQQRWQMIAELRESDEKPESVHHVSWAPNVGRPFELIAVASEKAVSIWKLQFPLNSRGRLVVIRAAHLPHHNGEVQHLDWDIVGMTLATSGKDGNVRLWQANVSGQWQQQGIVESTGEL